jgi:UPF0176 protein
MSIVNISGYKFIHLTRLLLLQADLKAVCGRLALKGTILLAEEGINIMLAGTSAAIEDFMAYLQQDTRFNDIQFKKSYSAQIPFGKLKVRIKKEIISIDLPEIDPTKQTATYLSPTEFKQWLDQGKEMVILDTRNRYEVAYGTFEQAIDLNIDTFKQFPEAVKTLADDMKKKPVVTFCTGGIRCEKAGAALLKAGFEQVYQLEGGQLNYFEHCGAAHYQGDCFVFDERVVVNPQLEVVNQVTTQ